MAYRSCSMGTLLMKDSDDSSDDGSYISHEEIEDEKIKKLKQISERAVIETGKPEKENKEGILTMELDTKQKEIVELKSSTQNLMERLNMFKLSATSERLRLGERIEHLEEELKRCKESNRILEKEKDDKSKELLEMKNMQQSQKMESKGCQISIIASEVKRTTEELKHVNDELSNRNAELLKHNKQLKIDIKDLKTSNNELKVKNNDFKISINEIKTNDKELRSSNIDLKLKIGEAQAKIDVIENYIEECIKSFKDILDKCLLDNSQNGPEDIRKEMEDTFRELEASIVANNEYHLNFFEKRNAVMKSGLEAINTEKKKVTQMWENFKADEQLIQDLNEKTKNRFERNSFMEKLLEVFSNDEENPIFSIGLDANQLAVKKKLKMEMILNINQCVTEIIISEDGKLSSETEKERFSVGYGSDINSSFINAIEDMQNNKIFMKYRKRARQEPKI